MSYPPPPPPPGPPPPGPPPPGGPYYQQPGGYYPPPGNSGKSIAILVLGIVSLPFACIYAMGLVPAIVALSLAPGAKREIVQSQGRVGGDSLIKAGVVCSWIAVGIAFVALLFLVLLIVVSVGSSSGDTNGSTDANSSIAGAMAWLGR